MSEARKRITISMPSEVAERLKKDCSQGFRPKVSQRIVELVRLGWVLEERLKKEEHT